MTDSILILGVVNVTPDSFSDGGQHADADAAIARAVELHDQGAHVIDVGGESTRPGADRVSVDEEQARVLPVLRGLVERGIPVSVDTMNVETARAAVEAGAAYINDVSGGLADSEMHRFIAASDVTYIASHWRGHSDAMQQNAHYDDVVAEVRVELETRLAELLIWGVDLDRVIVDPGLGFAKTAEHNWALLRGMPQLQSLGCRVLIGASRKRFLAAFAPEGAPAAERDEASATVAALASAAGAWGVRVHDVKRTARSLAVVDAWKGIGS